MWEKRESEAAVAIALLFSSVYTPFTTIFSTLWSSAYFSNILSHSSALTWRQWPRERQISLSALRKMDNFPSSVFIFSCRRTRTWSRDAWAPVKPRRKCYQKWCFHVSVWRGVCVWALRCCVKRHIFYYNLFSMSKVPDSDLTQTLWNLYPYW